MNIEGKMPFSVMAKPVGSRCNMRCHYCYYLEAESVDRMPECRQMPPELLERFICQYIEGNSGPVISFTWHGGEPTLAGIEFFKLAIELQKKYLPDGWECWNNIQTNGLLLDDQWCAFLAENRFDVGLSIDGSRLIHDQYRLDVTGKITYDRVVSAAKRLMEHGVKPDLLCTVTSDSEKDPLGVYRGLRELNTGWMQFIPIVRWDANGVVTPDSVTPEGYGRFLCAIFDQWVMHDLGRTQIQLFAETAEALKGNPPGLCWMAPECGRVLVVEKDGSVYSCDHFVNEEHLLGNIVENKLGELVEQQNQIQFGKAKHNGLTGQCRACQWLPLCGGGCPKDRFSTSKEGENGQYYLCAGLEMFFSNSVPKLRRVMSMRINGEKTEAIMEKFRQQERKRWLGIGRNDPCPCGSGKKAKNCCWDMRP